MIDMYYWRINPRRSMIDMYYLKIKYKGTPC